MEWVLADELLEGVSLVDCRWVGILRERGVDMLVVGEFGHFESLQLIYGHAMLVRWKKEKDVLVLLTPALIHVAKSDIRLVQGIEKLVLVHAHRVILLEIPTLKVASN